MSHGKQSFKHELDFEQYDLKKTILVIIFQAKMYLLRAGTGKKKHCFLSAVATFIKVLSYLLKYAHSLL